MGMTTVARIAAMSCAGMLALSGCSGDEASEGKPESKGVVGTAQCTLEGSEVAEVTLRATDEFVELTFEGQPVAQTGTTGFYASVFDKSGNVGGQLGMTFLDGAQSGYFFFDSPSAKQTNISGEPNVEGTRIVGTFPLEDLGDLADKGIASWTASHTRDGNDVGNCPAEGYRDFPE